MVQLSWQLLLMEEVPTRSESSQWNFWSPSWSILLVSQLSYSFNGMIPCRQVPTTMLLEPPVMLGRCFRQAFLSTPTDAFSTVLELSPLRTSKREPLWSTRSVGFESSLRCLERID